MLAVTRAVGDAERLGSTRRIDPANVPVDLDLAADGHTSTGEQLEQRGSATPDLARETHDLAASGLEVDRRGERRPGQAAHDRHRLTRTAATRRIQVLQRSPEHPLHELIGRELAHRHGRLAPAVAEDRHAIRELEHLAKSVRDVDDRAILGDQRPHDVLHAGDLGVGQGRGRFVEDEDACVAREQAGDLHELLLGDHEVRGRHRRVDAPEADLLQVRSGRDGRAPRGVWTARERGWPRNTFSAAESVGTRLSSCWTTAMPAWRRALPAATLCPARTISPLSGRTSPARILTSVLLPAPFSPTSAMTSPTSSSKSTASSAWIVPYAFDIPVMRRSASRSTGTEGPDPSGAAEGVRGSGWSCIEGTRMDGRPEGCPPGDRSAVSQKPEQSSRKV